MIWLRIKEPERDMTFFTQSAKFWSIASVTFVCNFPRLTCRKSSDLAPRTEWIAVRSPHTTAAIGYQCGQLGKNGSR